MGMMTDKRIENLWKDIAKDPKKYGVVYIQYQSYENNSDCIEVLISDIHFFELFEKDSIVIKDKIDNGWLIAHGERRYSHTTASVKWNNVIFHTVYVHMDKAKNFDKFTG